MNDTLDTRSIAEFQDRFEEFLGDLKRRRSPLVLTSGGRAEIVVQDAQSYQELLDRLQRAETIAAIRTGLEQSERGEGILADKAEKALRAKHGFSR